jgi:hypothetical protein
MQKIDQHAGNDAAEFTLYGQGGGMDNRGTMMEVFARLSRRESLAKT